MQKELSIMADQNENIFFEIRWVVEHAREGYRPLCRQDVRLPNQRLTRLRVQTVPQINDLQ